MPNISDNLDSGLNALLMNPNSYRYKIKPLQTLISHSFYWNCITFSPHQALFTEICSKVPFLPASYSANNQLNMTILSSGEEKHQTSIPQMGNYSTMEFHYHSLDFDVCAAPAQDFCGTLGLFFAFF
ncbi:hypothetical protein Bca101_011670 [Brassica carinata]